MTCFANSRHLIVHSSPHKAELGLSLDRITKVYVDRRSGRNLTALANISLDVRDGEFVCIIGPSGCGKSTLLKIVAHLIPPTRGTIRVRGREVHAPGADRGMVFQEYALFPWKTVRENVEFGLLVKGISKAARAQRVRDYITLIGLKGFEDRYPRELSGGMKQRVAVARALANDPDLLLLDEPFAAVDALTRQRLQEELARISEKTKTTMLFVTHSVDEAAFLADRIVVLSKRPGAIQEIVDVSLGRPRIWKKIAEDSSFKEISRHLLEKLHAMGDEPETNEALV